MDFSDLDCLWEEEEKAPELVEAYGLYIEE